VDREQVNRRVIEQFRAGGEIEGMHRDRLLLLTTRGAATGKERVAPMMFHRDGDMLYVIASNNGAKHNPLWYLNLVEDARVTVEVGDDKFDAIASTIAGVDRARVWSSIVRDNPFFADHQAGVEREIPVVALSPVE
jgi:deazaflavin-dependent oxidoreductase (nitroreductase family)